MDRYCQLRDRASQFVSEFATSGAVLVLAPERAAADEVARSGASTGTLLGVHRLGFRELAPELAGTEMNRLGLVPVGRIVREALAARVASRTELTYLRPVAAFPGFPRALTDTLEELRLNRIRPEQLRACGQSGPDLAQLLAAYEAELEERRFADHARRVGLALAHVNLTDTAVVVLDVTPRTLLERQLLEAIMRSARTAVDLRLSPGGSPPSTSLESLQKFLFSSSSVPGRPEDGTVEIFSTSGEALECVEIARRIVQADVPFDETAILLRSPERHQPLVVEALRRAEIPAHCTHGTVRPDAAGRSFLALLYCAEEGLSASRFAEYLSLGQMREDEEPHTAAQWERLLIDSAVIGGPERWRTRLRGLREELARRYREAQDPAIERRVSLIDNLADVALPIIDRLAALPRRGLWREWIEALTELAEFTLGEPDQVVELLEQLDPMADIGPIALTDVLLTVGPRLNTLRAPTKDAPYGKVWIGGIEEARGMAFRHVFVPGINEGLFPRAPADDPLLWRSQREALGIQLPGDDSELLRIAAACASERLVLSFSRLDLLTGRERVPSFYAFAAHRAAGGREIDVRQFEERARAATQTKIGWPAPHDPLDAIDAAEFDLATLAPRTPGSGQYLKRLPGRALPALRARWMRWHKPWKAADGLVIEEIGSDALKPYWLTARPWSPSALQQYARCPYRFALHGIFGLRPSERPQAIQRLDPLTRGQIYHEVQFQLLRDGGENALERLNDVLSEVAERWKDELVPAIPQIWDAEVRSLRADLRGWLQHRVEAEAGWTPVAAELSFGLPDPAGRDPISKKEPVTIDGALLKGSIDLVERHSSGVLRVVDHKTGRLPEPRPEMVGGGEMLQPALYALSAEQMLGEPVQLGRLYYSTIAQNYTSIDVPLNEWTKRRAAQALAVIDGAIRDGFLPAAPRKDGCKGCEYLPVCGPYEEERVAVKSQAELGRLKELRGVAMSTVVEASAGTGKTTALVNRIVDAIAAGTAVEAIVAVTFTHAAAGNMKLRVRQELERRGNTRPDPETRALLAQAARSLDRAFIGTIHAFCAQLLRRRPVEAGVDPVFQELAQADAMRVFGNVFRAWIQKRLASPSPALTRALARLSWREERDGASPLDALRLAAWSLTEWRDFDAPWEKRAFDRDARLTALIAKAESTADLRTRTGRRFRDGLQPLAEFVLRARKLDPNLAESELLRLPREMRWIKPQGQRDPVFASWEELKAAIEEFGGEADADLAAHLREEMWDVVGLYQAQKRCAGQLDFMDLLLHARELLRHNAARAELQQAYQRIFVDEFQDTDPLQAEILLLLAAADPAERDWRKATPKPGKLFVVGDPKQSIYRFRRADARLFHRVYSDLKAAGAEQGKLTASTRSRKAIQAFVNAAFEEKIPAYLPLDGGIDGPGDQPAVVALPMPKPYGTRNLSNVKIEECSPHTVAAFIEWLCTESGWKVRDWSTGEWVAVRPEHVCILFRRFTNFGVDLTQEYVRALEARGIEHLLVGSKSFHRREEVGTIRTALRAIEWPDDELSVFAVLRGSLCAVLDDTLLRFKNAHGGFHAMRALPADLDPEFEPIRDAFALLRNLHRQRNYRPIADTIRELLETVRAHAAFAFRTGGERVLANVYRLTDLARSFEIGGAATSFRAFVEYLESEYEVGDTSEAPVLEQEGGGVQLMTVHKAKGLEFPVVILADLTAKLTGPQGGDRYTDPGRRLCAQRLLWCAPWELRDALETEARADEEEALRVAYVAATRARDLLVVAAIGEAEHEGGWLSPLHDALYPPKETWRTPEVAQGCPKFGGATVLNRPPDQPEEISIKPGLHYPQAGDQPVVWFDPAVLALEAAKTGGVENEQVLSGTTEQAIEGLRRYEEWKGRRAARTESGGLPRYRIATVERMGATAEAEGIPVETITLPLEPGRPAGRHFGRVVHDILQRADRVEDVTALARICGRRHGVTGADCEAAATVTRSALERIAELVPKGARRLREMPLLVRLEDGTLVDGRIDFAWSDGSRWTVIDYKTDRRERRRAGQLQLYALALQQATGLPARGIVLEI